MMSSYVDMSLEDIIKKKKGGSRIKRAKPTIQPSTNNNQIMDARNKIISRKRTQITDAREKLAQLAKQKDARLKLEKLRQERARLQGEPRNIFSNRGKFTRAVLNKERVFTDISRQVVSQPLHISKIVQNRQLNIGRNLTTARQLINQRNRHTGRQSDTGRQLGSGRLLNNRRQLNIDRAIENTKFHDMNNRKKLQPILRTVENDLEIIDDPMDDEYTPPKPSSLNRQTSLQLKIITNNDDIQDKRISTVHRSAIAEKEKSPPRPQSILKKRPMAALRSDSKVQKSDKSSLEFRIIVSNLRNTVTAGDIEELFGDVGGMLESRLVRPGTAEVMYKTQEDAQRAVDLYHNRQLDGQPMNCLLVTPRSPAANTRNNSKPALYSTNSNVEPDISTFHKVLFSNL